MDVLLAAVVVGCTSEHAAVPGSGANPHPVRLVRPVVAPLSPLAQIGRALFFDVRLSQSGRQSCASCHSPARAYGPPDSGAVQMGGPGLRDQGARAVPSLRYLDRVPNFSIGPDRPEAENVNIGALAVQSNGAARPAKSAGGASSGGAMVPRGGLFWDGRVNTLQDQTMGPLFNPVEMANVEMASVAGRIRDAYGARLAVVLGTGRDVPDRRLIDEAMFAVARFQVEDSTFHPYDSKYDAYLEGRAVLSPGEARGLALFENPQKGNCAACHPSRPGADGRPPTFTDYQYEALGVPRNHRLTANRSPSYFDMGLCGPFRTDLAAATQYCGMFRTPSLRNTAVRGVYFHNGVYHTLEQVLAFYDFRDARPDSIYPVGPDGRVEPYDDLPPRYRRNVDTLDAPFGRRRGQGPALSAAERRDLIAFLGTLTDGYRP